MTETKNMQAVFAVMKSNIDELETATDGDGVGIPVDPNVIIAKRAMLKILKNHPEDPRCERFSSLLRMHPVVERWEWLTYYTEEEDGEVGYDTFSYTVEEYMNKSGEDGAASVELNKAITREARKALNIISQGKDYGNGCYVEFDERTGVILRSYIRDMLESAKTYSLLKEAFRGGDYEEVLLEIGAHDFVHGY